MFVGEVDLVSGSVVAIRMGRNTARGDRREHLSFKRLSWLDACEVKRDPQVQLSQQSQGIRLNC